jgi:23S rRNA (uracil1939-C5)-methyltransferase
VSEKRTARRPSATRRLTIDTLAFGGDAVGRDDDGRVTFVPGGAPGDAVVVELVEEHKGYARSRLLRVVSPGAARVTPPCPLVVAEPSCGGCQWQHVHPDAQRAAKAAIVERALRRTGAEIRPILSPSPATGWRRRARLRYRRGVLGIVARRSHVVVDVDRCLQLEPRLEAALAALRAVLLPRLGGGSGELELLVGGQGAVHVVIHGPPAAAAETAEIAETRAAAATLVGRAGIAGIDVAGVDVGAPRIDLADDDGVPFWSRADVFAQASAPGNLALRALVREAAGELGGTSVLELHAGSGNFTRDLAAGAAQVVAVEQAGPATALLGPNLAARSLAAQVTIVTAPVAEALAGAGRPGLIVVDPPRTGLGPGEARAIAGLSPRRVVYVSCDPETLARDLDVFMAAGYEVAWAQPVDLMPHTFHVETAVSLKRRA